MKKIRLLIAEDHNLVRYGLVNTLHEFETISIVAEADSGDSLVEKYFQFQPDIVLSDISMPRRDGFQAARKILNKDKHAKIIFLTMHSTDKHIYDAMKLGVKGLISKEVLKDELLSALETIMRNNTYYCGYSEEKLNEIYQKFENTKEPENVSHKYKFTEREIDILRLLALGLSNEEIGEKLYISTRTVETYRASIKDKTNIQTTPELVIFAFRFFGDHSN